MDLTGILLLTGCVIAWLAIVVLGFAPMLGWRIAAKHEEFIRFSPESLSREKIREAFIELGWTQCGEERDAMVARTRLNWRSWARWCRFIFATMERRLNRNARSRHNWSTTVEIV